MAQAVSTGWSPARTGPRLTHRERPALAVAGTYLGRLRIGSEASSGADWVVVQSPVRSSPPALLT